MTRLAVTGHRGLPEPTARIIATALDSEIAQRATPDLIGLTCLADGADTLFAHAILAHGGQLHVIIPAHKYRAGLPADHHPTYDALLAQAARVTQLDHEESDSDAHLDASLHMLTEADEVLAIWDGQPARGPGGTADVVAVAGERGLSVTVVWPTGAQRD